MIYSSGVRYPSDFLGRLFSFHSTSAMNTSVSVLKSVPLGMYWRIRPLVFSFAPLSQEWYGVEIDNAGIEIQDMSHFFCLSRAKIGLLRIPRREINLNARYATVWQKEFISLRLLQTKKGQKRLFASDRYFKDYRRGEVSK